MCVAASKNVYLMWMAEFWWIIKNNTDEKCSKGFNIFMLYFKLKHFEYWTWFSTISGYVNVNLLRNIILFGMNYAVKTASQKFWQINSV